MSSNPTQRSAAALGPLPTKTRSKSLIVASMLVAASMAVSWFEAPPVPALVGVIGAGGLLLWRSRRV
jgi:MYXO-CTERM domain-containing protein